MTDLERAKEFYLRGFRSTYIKRRTGIRSGELKQNFPDIDKPTIMKYQVQYLNSRYTDDEIAEAIEQALSVPNVENQIKSRAMMVLGCAFGPFDKVFTELLGKERFLDIKKRSERVRADGPQISGREARTQTMLARYGFEGPNGNPEIAAHMMASLTATNRKRYGVDYPMQVPDIAARSAKSRQKSMMDKYGAPNSVQVPEIREKILESRKRNGTLTSSSHEIRMCKLLVERFGDADVVRNYKDDRYPSYADFYIRSRDLFIELNADRSHGMHWFDNSDPKDIQKAAEMKQKAESIDKDRQPCDKTHKSRYWNYIRVWTVLDVEKRAAAKEHRLNYLVFWDSSFRVVDGVKQPKLKDFHEWLAAGCPDSKDWKKENTW